MKNYASIEKKQRSYLNIDLNTVLFKKGLKISIFTPNVESEKEGGYS